MSLGPIQNIVTALLAQLIVLGPIVGGVALAFFGFILMLGNHNRAKEGIICGVLGIAVVLGAQTIASSVHA